MLSRSSQPCCKDCAFITSTLSSFVSFGLVNERVFKYKVPRYHVYRNSPKCIFKRSCGTMIRGTCCSSAARCCDMGVHETCSSRFIHLHRTARGRLDYLVVASEGIILRTSLSKIQQVQLLTAILCGSFELISESEVAPGTLTDLSLILNKNSAGY